MFYLSATTLSIHCCGGTSDLQKTDELLVTLGVPEFSKFLLSGNNTPPCQSVTPPPPRAPRALSPIRTIPKRIIVLEIWFLTRWQQGRVRRTRKDAGTRDACMLAERGKKFMRTTSECDAGHLVVLNGDECNNL